MDDIVDIDNDVEVHLRISNLAEFPELVPILAQWHHEEWLKDRELAPDFDKNQSLEKRASVLRSHFVKESLPRSFVAMYYGRPIATVSLVYFGFTPEVEKRSLWLTNLYVEPELRGVGLGALMLDYAWDYAQKYEHSLEKVMLYTRDKQDFYRKHGWQNAGSGRVQGQDVFILSKAL